MIRRARQSGVALFTAVFLIVAVGVLAVSVALISGQQQLSSAQSLDQTRAYYVARARLDREIAELLSAGQSCDTPPETNASDLSGFTTTIARCATTNVTEGGSSYDIHDLSVRAARGSRTAGTLVQRTVRVQVTDGP